MRNFILAVAWTAAIVTQAQAFDGQSAARRMGLLLGVAAMPQAPEAPSAAAVVAEKGTVFPDDLWETLSAPDRRTLAQLILRCPGLAPEEIREIPLEKADQMMSSAAQRDLTGLDIFSDPGLRGRHIFYLSEKTLEVLFQKFDLKALTLSKGNDIHGRPYHMDAILAGDGKVVILYDRDKFDFTNPYYTDFHYQGGSRIVYTILGDNDLAIEGLKVDAVKHPRITRVRKTAANQMHVDASWMGMTMGEDKPLWPVQVRPGFEPNP